MRRPIDTATHKTEIVDKIRATIGPNKSVERDILSGNHGLLYGLPMVNSTFPLRLQRVDNAALNLAHHHAVDGWRLEYFNGERLTADAIA